jgi:serine protease Do
MRTLFILLATVCFGPSAAFSQGGHATKAALAETASATLAQLSTSLQDVARKVEPAVVQIFNSSYAVERGGETVVLQQRSSGSGVLIASDGYIVTNAHVVAGSRRLQVRLNAAVPNIGSRLVNAKLIGKDRQTDLAVIKIDLEKLPFLAFEDSDTLSQGQIVLAFGSPLGLDNSVSMGVVSAVDRQLSADDPAVYIQTDAAINPGNSGGPLVNTAGQVVGLNTFILTKSGGSEGVGFAIPGNLVSTICRQIRIDHHVHHHQIGIAVRAITPAIAKSLNLPVEEGLVIEDVAPQSTADLAGLRIGDVITMLHGHTIQNVRQLALNMYSYDAGEKAEIAVLRGQERLSFSVSVVERADDPQRFEDLVTERDNAIAKLGILGLNIDKTIAAQLPPLRAGGGVLVAAKMAAGGTSRFGDELATGDIIHMLNGTDVTDVASLRGQLAALADDATMVLQVERMGRLQFVVLDDN